VHFLKNSGRHFADRNKYYMKAVLKYATEMGSCLKDHFWGLGTKSQNHCIANNQDKKPRCQEIRIRPRSVRNFTALRQATISLCDELKKL
jgi:hypothetical protein